MASKMKIENGDMGSTATTTKTSPPPPTPTDSSQLKSPFVVPAASSSCPEVSSSYTTDLAQLTREGYAVFVGDTGDLKEEDLHEAFKRFENILRISLKRDRFSGRSKHYGFITFAEEASAEKAIKEMNGAWVKSSRVRVNWAASNTPQPRRVLSYDQISQKASLRNTTVFCGYLKGTLTGEMLKNEFAPFGPIVDIKCYTEKGYGFVRFQDRNSAIRAIFEKNGKPFDGDRNGTKMKVSWGKEVTSFDYFNTIMGLGYSNTWNLSNNGYGNFTTGAEYNGLGGGGVAMHGGGGARPSSSYPSEYMNMNLCHYYGYQYYAPYGYAYMCSPTTAPGATATPTQRPPPGFPPLFAPAPVPTMLPYVVVEDSRDEAGTGDSCHSGRNGKGS